MNLINCIDCGAVCVESPSRLCAKCVRDEEEAEDRVAEYLRNTKKASLEEIHQATGVKHRIILRMLKRGRIVSDTIITYPCETCGAPISGGRLCESCSKNIVDQIKTEEKKPEKRLEESRKEERMYTRDLLQKNSGAFSREDKKNGQKRL